MFLDLYYLCTLINDSKDFFFTNSGSKIFERLILKRIAALELIHDVELVGSQQHGFRKGKSTATAHLSLQSLICRALDENNYVAMASIDLSAAFDIVNVDLLIFVKRSIPIVCFAYMGLTLRQNK